MNPTAITRSDGVCQILKHPRLLAAVTDVLGDVFLRGRDRSAHITRSDGACQILRHLVKISPIIARSLLKNNIDDFRDVFLRGEGRI